MKYPRTSLVATEPVPSAAERAFARLGPITLAGEDRPEVLARAVVLIVRTSPISADALRDMPRLRVIARTGVGMDNIDLDAATRCQIPVLHAPDTATRPIAEGTLALIFAATKRLPELGALVREGRWSERYAYEVSDLHGAVLGVVGLGRVGSEVARLGRALGMHVVACDPRYEHSDPPPGVPATIMSLSELFSCVDVATLHCPLIESTRGMINRELLESGKRGKVLVNASRGLLVDDAAVIEALNKGWLAAVGLDVFASEPPTPDSVLLRHPRVVCTPHSVGLSRAWNAHVFNALADDVERVLGGQSPTNIANPEALGARFRAASRLA
jgi:D-3-phosphoglycerate dehydrogenase / 2-oxoglutarate reductase